MPFRYRPYTPRPRKSPNTDNHSDSSSNQDNMSTGDIPQDIPQGAQAPGPDDINRDEDFFDNDSSTHQNNTNFQESFNDFESKFFDKFAKMFSSKANISSQSKHTPHRPDTPATFAVKSTEMSQVHNTHTHLQTQTDIINTDLGIINALEHIANGENQECLPLLNVLKDKIIQRNETVQNQARQIKKTFEVANYYKPSINRPSEFPDPQDIIPDLTLEILKTKNVLKAIKIFNPDKPNSDFCEHWRQIMSYTRKHFLSEEQFLDILGLTLYGPALRVFDDLMPSNPSLDIVLDRLVQLYGSKRTILDDQRELNSFTRRANEDIKTAICRARCLNERLKPLYPSDSWLDTSNRTLKQILKSILLPQTKSHLECEELKCLKIGASMDIDSMIDLVDTYEISHKLVPTIDTGIDAKSTPIQSNVMESSIETHYEINSAVHRTNMAKRSRPFKPYGTSQRAQAIKSIPNVTRQDTSMTTLAKPSIYPLTQAPGPTYSQTQQTQGSQNTQSQSSTQTQPTYGSQSQTGSTYGARNRPPIGSTPYTQSSQNQALYGQNVPYRPFTPYGGRSYGQNTQGFKPFTQGYTQNSQGYNSRPYYRPYGNNGYRGRYQGNQRFQGYQRPQNSYQRPQYNPQAQPYKPRALMAPRNSDGQDQRILVTINENPYYMCKCHSMHLADVSCPLEKEEQTDP